MLSSRRTRATIGAAFGALALAAGSAAAISTTDPGSPDSAEQAATIVIRTAPARLWLGNLSAPAQEPAPIPGTLSSGLTSRHIGGPSLEG
jgi:hypothetical protein